MDIDILFEQESRQARESNSMIDSCCRGEYDPGNGGEGSPGPTSCSDMVSLKRHAVAPLMTVVGDQYILNMRLKLRPANDLATPPQMPQPSPLRSRAAQSARELSTSNLISYLFFKFKFF